MSELQVVYEVSYWVTLSVLSVMTLLVAASLFIRWTSLPVDPSTLAGAMYFVMDNDLLGELGTSERVSSKV